ncbi:MAG: MqnA/MqnD/SBP family protein [Thermoplasmataceae archaeon]
MIALINLIHSDPLYLALSSSEEITRNSPQENLKLVMEGKAECGMVSLLDYFKNRDALNLIKGPNIHSKGRTISTIVISEGETLSSGSRIAVTSQTETTLFYLEQIIEREFPQTELIKLPFISPKELLKEEQFALVIGDEALKAYSGQYRILIDVGLQYSKLFSYYPVYSVMVSSEKIKEERIREINEKAAEYTSYVKESREINIKTGFSPELIKSYYNVISYSFDDIVRRSIDYSYMRFKR